MNSKLINVLQSPIFVVALTIIWSVITATASDRFFPIAFMITTMLALSFVGQQLIKINKKQLVKVKK